MSPMEGTAPDGRATVQPLDRAAWRSWLAANHTTSTGAWVVTFKKTSGKPRLEYDEIVEEALCFGWIDSKPNKLDDERTMLWLAPRKPKSAWSRPNKERVEQMMAAGLMTEAGLRMVELAKQSGTWDLLNDVENLVVPDDLAEAFARHPGSREQWDGFSRSSRRGILEWIIQAKKPDTRAARVEETARLAAAGEKANQWKPKS
jgi:uncharacterized protein YdeI (YjbR/CyaY-like superfamily)